MKLLDITEFYADASGGVRTYLAAKARYATQRGWEHVLVVPGREDGCQVSGRARTYHIKSPRLPFCGPYRLLCDERKVRDVLDQERPDVVEVGSPYFAPWLARRALRRLRRRTPVVGFFHSDFPTAYVRPAARRFGRRLAARAERWAWRYARHVYGRFSLTLAASPHVAATLTARGIPRVRCVRLGVDLELFHPDRRDPAFRRALGIPADGRLLLYAGRLAAEKGIRTLLDAFPLLPAEHRLLVIGDGPSAGEVAAFARRHPRVLVRGHEDDRARLATAYASADLLVAPGPFETFGLAVVEAQACGLPVVAVRGGAVPALVAPGGGLARPFDPADLAAAVRRTAAADRQALGRAARAHVEAHFGWSAALQELAAVYEQLAGCGIP